MAVARSILNISSRGQYGTFDPDFFDKYTAIRYYLSKGASGNVYGPIPWNDTTLAIKQATFADGKVTEKFKKDIDGKQKIWTSLEHKHITRIHAVDLSQLPKVMFIVMEFAAGGSLHKTLRSLGSDNKLPIDVVTKWAKQIAEGMVYLHEKNIVHRDLKSSNILLMEPFHHHNRHQKVTLKIADFDEIKELEHTTTMSFVGTIAYMAPEVLRDQWFSKGSDIWSYGVVVWEMLSGDSPHKDLEPTAIMRKSIIGELNKLPIDHSFPEDFQLLLNECWKLDYEERSSFHDIFCLLHSKALYESCPVLLETIKPTKESPVKESTAFSGFTILDKGLFIVSRMSSKVDVYDSINFSFSRQWKLKELVDPWDIVGLSITRNKCLYIYDYGVNDRSHGILRVDVNGNLIGKWSTGVDWKCSLSVTQDSNLVLTCHYENKLKEYSPDGQLIREINLSSDAGIRRPNHAIKLTNGNFMVSHSDSKTDLHRVCIVDTGGKLLKSFGGKRGSSTREMNGPVHLSVDGNGTVVMVADHMNNRILLLDSDLKFISEILSPDQHELNYPTKILLDESNDLVFLADDDLINARRILIFRLRIKNKHIFS